MESNSQTELSKPFHMEALLVLQLLSRAFCIRRQKNENPAKTRRRRWPRGRSFLNNC